MKQLILSVAGARNLYLRRWLPLLVFIFIIWCLQFAMGRFAEMESAALIWMLVHFLPMPLLLVASNILNPYPEKTIQTSTLVIFIAIGVLYLIMVLFSLLLIPVFIRFSDLGLSTYFTYSYTWLSVFHLLALYGVYELFIQKTPRNIPAVSQLTLLATQQANKAREKVLLKRAECLSLLAKDDLESTLERMRQAFQQNPHHINEIVVLSGTYYSIKNHLTQGLLDGPGAELALNKIRQALINLSDRIDN